jgi:hypothetical protein
MHSSAGWTGIKAYDRTNNIGIGLNAYNYSLNLNNAMGDGGASLIAIVSPVTDIDIDIRFININNTNGISEDLSWLLIEEYGGY